MSDVLLIAGAATFGVLGAAHLVQTLLDLRKPRFFMPVDESLVARMNGTGVRLSATAPGAKSLWKAWMGVNLTHSLGLIAFAGLVILAGAAGDGVLAQLPALRPVAACVGGVYAIIAFRFFFVPPAAMATAATALLTVACFV